MIATESRTSLGVRRASFPGIPASAKQARHWVAATLTGWALPEHDTLMIVVSELVTNALTHSYSGEPGRQFSVRLHRLENRVRVEVRDAGPLQGRAPTRQTPKLTAENGRGLQLVDDLADSWGRLPHGTGVFADVSWKPRT